MVHINATPRFGRHFMYAGKGIGSGFPPMDHDGIREALRISEDILGYPIRAPWEDADAPAWGEPESGGKSLLRRITDAVLAPVKFLWRHKGLALLAGAALLAFVLGKGSGVAKTEGGAPPPMI